MQFADLAIAQACPRHRFLEEMSRIIPWKLFNDQLEAEIHHKTGGRRPYPRLLLFKMHLLQTWFGLTGR
jgi:IS5 family transposase